MTDCHNNIVHLVEGFSFNDKDNAYISPIPELEGCEDGYYFEYKVGIFEGPYPAYGQRFKAMLS